MLATGLLCATAAVFAVTTHSVAAPQTSTEDNTAPVRDPVKLQALQDIRDAVTEDPDRYAGTSTDGLSKITVYVVGDASSRPAVEGDLDSRPVRSARNSCRGCEIDFDGSYTGQSRGHLVSEGDSTDCLRFSDGALACHVVQVRGDNGADLCNHGDSGGPVFAFDGQGGVIAVGVIEALATGNPNTCWYTRIVPILAHCTSTIYTVY